MPEEKKSEAVLVQVPVEVATAFKLEDESVVDEKTLLLKIYNDIQKIKKDL